jgi:hypothetical protein
MIGSPTGPWREYNLKAKGESFMAKGMDRRKETKKPKKSKAK